MRSLPLLLSSGVLLLGLVPQQVILPVPLAKHYETLAAAPSLTAEYRVRVVGEPPAEYKLVLTRPGKFRLTTPTGYVNSDGVTVTTYTTATKTYTEEPYDAAWIATFIKKPEVVAWAGYLEKDPVSAVVGAKNVGSRTIQGNEVSEVELSLKKDVTPITMYVDKKLGVARGFSQTINTKPYLVMAQVLEVGTAPVESTKFAFVPPAGSKKVEVAAADFKGVKSIIDAKCMPCHSAQNRRANVDLSTYNGIVATVTPGDPANSRLIKSVIATARDRMPKNGTPLTDAQIKLIETWIKDGAKQ